MNSKMQRRARAVGCALMILAMLPRAGMAHPKGTLRIADPRLTVGAWLPVRGERFGQGATLALALEGASGRHPLGQVRVGADGAFADSVRIPAEAAPGAYRLVARATDGDLVAGLDVQLSAATAAPRPEPMPNAMHEAMGEPSAEPLELARARNSAVTAGAVIVIIASLGLGAVLLRRPATLSNDRS